MFKNSLRFAQENIRLKYGEHKVVIVQVQIMVEKVDILLVQLI
jgi:hypothetical protein